MITRQPSINDYSKLAELTDRETIANWMLYAKDNMRVLSLVTIEKKEVVAGLLIEYNQFIERLETFLFLCPEDRPSIGTFLYDKAYNYFKEKNMIAKDATVLSLAQETTKFNSMGFKPTHTIFIKEMQSV